MMVRKGGGKEEGVVFLHRSKLLLSFDDVEGVTLITVNEPTRQKRQSTSQASACSPPPLYGCFSFFFFEREPFFAAYRLVRERPKAAYSLGLATLYFYP